MPPLKTILCVDDDPVARLLMQKSIENIGNYKSVEAKSGKDCLEYISKNKVDLIILDYNLGDMEGSEVCKLIPTMSMNLDVPVIISSVLDRHIVRMRCEYHNVVKVVQKPYDIDCFYQDLKEILV